MDIGSSTTPSERVLASLEEKLGPRKKQGAFVGEDDWRRVFNAITDMKVPRGWESAVSTWTGASTWTVSNRWKLHDTSVHRRGRPPLLPSNLETAFAQRIVDRSFIGNGMKPRELRVTLRNIARQSGGENVGGSRGHYRCFKHRHPDLRDRVAEATKATRLLGPTRAGGQLFYDNYERVGGRTAPPGIVYNVDEADAQAFDAHPHVVGPSYHIMKRIAVPDPSTSTHISLAAVGSAEGLPLGKPIFILAGASVSSNSVEDTEDYLVIATKSGGMEGFAWEQCCKYWASLAKSGDIFIVDGHSSHEDFLANEIMADKGINVVTLDPNCTHIYQVCGLDVCAEAASAAPGHVPWAVRNPALAHTIWEQHLLWGLGGRERNNQGRVGHFTN